MLPETDELSPVEFLDDIKTYVGFGPDDAAVLAELVPILGPHFSQIAEGFYARIFAHPEAHAAITGGTEQITRLKCTLAAWMESGLRGPHDESFYEMRARIGRRHVEIGLPQQYMVTAVGAMRQDYRDVIHRTLTSNTELYRRAQDAIDRLMDMELAIMLQTYRIDSEDRLRRSERLVTLGMVAASIGHDLRNPLGVIESSAFILQRTVHDERGLRHLQKIQNQVRNCNRIVSSLLELARSRPPRFVDVDPNALFDTALSMVHAPDNVAIHRTVTADLRVRADAGLLEQALVNLITNALQALGNAGGRVWLEAGRHSDRYAQVSVADDGPGFDDGILPQVFEPLITTRPSGVGLGLALVKSVAERHGGVVSAENRQGGGALVRFLLPWGPSVTPP